MELVDLQVNGSKHRVEVDGERSLLSVLRDELDLTGAKYGCGEGQCGACTVLVDGRALRSCVTRANSGKIVNSATKQTLSYGQLTQGQRLMKAIGETKLKPAAQWRFAGRALHKIAGRDIITGKHRYTPDLTRPGTLHGKILRPAAFGATAAAVDIRAAEKLPGVTVVRDGDFVAVAAPTEHQAAQALAAIRARVEKRGADLEQRTLQSFAR